MYSEEESELRDLIIQNLENSGFLKKIKAELRAGVFLALEEDGNLRNKIPLFNEKFDEYACTSDGKLILSLVREFLEFFNLNFTLSVFDPEVASSSPLFSRPELCDHLDLNISEVNGPIISALLKDIIRNQKINPLKKSSDDLKKVPEKFSSVYNETLSENLLLDKTYNIEQIDQNQEKFILQNNIKTETVTKSSEEDLKGNFNDTNVPGDADVDPKNVLENHEGNNQENKKDSPNDFFTESKDVLSSDHDPFFDEPVPSEKTFFSFSDTSKDKSESNILSNMKRDVDDSKKSSLSSLRDLPSLSANNEWSFSRDPKNNLPSLNILKSFASSEKPKEEINLDSKKIFERKDSDIAESNEESSEKQISEESIEEEIEEDFSAGMDDLLNSSLSLGDEVTTDQTVSQVSVVEGVDHIEPCNS